MLTPKEYQSLLEGGCPYCGEALEIKHGKYGEFVACSEWCGFKKGIPGKSEYPPPKKQKVCPHKKCDGSGLLPFAKHSKVMAGVFTHCSCHSLYGDAPATEKYTHMEIKAFDFPMSETFRVASFEYCNQPDPGRIPPEPEATPPQVRVITKPKYAAQKILGAIAPTPYKDISV